MIVDIRRSLYEDKKIKEINSKEVCDILNSIMEYELAGVVRYTHSSMMVSGPYRLPIVSFLKEQAAESFSIWRGVRPETVIVVNRLQSEVEN